MQPSWSIKVSIAAQKFATSKVSIVAQKFATSTLMIAPLKVVTIECIEHEVTCLNERVFIKTMNHLLTDCSQSTLLAMICRLSLLVLNKQSVKDYVMQSNESFGVFRLIFPSARAGRRPVIGWKHLGGPWPLSDFYRELSSGCITDWKGSDTTWELRMICNWCRLDLCQVAWNCFSCDCTCSLFFFVLVFTFCSYILLLVIATCNLRVTCGGSLQNAMQINILSSVLNSVRYRPNLGTLYVIARRRPGMKDQEQSTHVWKKSTSVPFALYDRTLMVCPMNYAHIFIEYKGLYSPLHGRTTRPSHFTGWCCCGNGCTHMWIFCLSTRYPQGW